MFSPPASLNLTHTELIGSTEMSYLIPAAILSVYDVLKLSRRVELCQHLVSISEEADTTVCGHAMRPYRIEVLKWFFQTAIREMLVTMTEDSSVASSLLAWIRGSANDAAERPAKRARLDRYAVLLFINILLTARSESHPHLPRFRSFARHSLHPRSLDQWRFWLRSSTP